MGYNVNKGKDLTIEDDGQELEIKYRSPKQSDVKKMRDIIQVNKKDADEMDEDKISEIDEKNSDIVADYLAGVILDWNVENEDGNKVNVINADNLKKYLSNYAFGQLNVELVQKRTNPKEVLDQLKNS